MKKRTAKTVRFFMGLGKEIKKVLVKKLEHKKRKIVVNRLSTLF